ncbi:hypothetical protein HY025_03010, partial [Candidatus Daviesbacteria bacterium]|nr:hypothetical protein [Candidatus Daviesbacteria bacterium]
GEHPNNAVVQGIVITQDNHLVLTTKATSADYHAGSISPSFEEQLNGQKDNSPFDTYLRAVSSSPKLRRGEELKLNVDADSIRLMGLALEPEFNAAGFIMLGKCQQNSSEIDQSVFGIDQAEFDPSRPIWTLPLDPPDQLTKEFFQPSLKWHGVGRLRVITALSYVNGYEETLDMLYKQSQVI